MYTYIYINKWDANGKDHDGCRSPCASSHLTIKSSVIPTKQVVRSFHVAPNEHVHSTPKYRPSGSYPDSEVWQDRGEYYPELNRRPPNAPIIPSIHRSVHLSVRPSVHFSSSVFIHQLNCLDNSAISHFIQVV